MTYVKLSFLSFVGYVAYKAPLEGIIMYWNVVIVRGIKKPEVLPEDNTVLVPPGYIMTIYVMTWSEYWKFVDKYEGNVHVITGDDERIVFWVDDDLKDMLPDASMYVRVDT